MKQLDRLRTWLGLKLLVSPSFTAKAWDLKEATEKYKCVRCGKNPFLKEDVINPLDYENNLGNENTDG